MRKLANYKKVLISVVALFFMLVPNAYAQQPVIVTGTLQLAKDITFWIAVLLAPVTTGAMLAFFAWQKSMASGEGEATESYNKKMKRTLIGGIITVTASGLATLILGYFNAPTP